VGFSPRHRAAAAVYLLAIVACGCDWSRRFVGVGDVVSVDDRAQQVTVRHEAIPGLMDASTTAFAVDDDVRATLAAGARIRFVLRRSGGRLRMTKATVLAAGSPGLHDHTPHHGGIVAMVGMSHLEALASPDGRIRVYLTDLWRQPLSVTDAGGTVVLDLPGGKQTLPLEPGDGMLTAVGPPLAALAAVNAHVAVRRGAEPLEVSFLLPVSAGASGAAGIPSEGCVALPAATPGTPAPRCVFAFAKPVVALAATADATTLLVAMVDLGMTAWHLPGGTFALGFAPPPAVQLPAPEAPHPEAPNAVVIRPGGRELVIAMENRLIRYALDTGRVAAAFNGPGGIVRDVAWSPDGSSLLVSAFYQRAGFMLDPEDGGVTRRLPIDAEGAAVAVAPDGRTLAIGSEPGTIDLFDASGAGRTTLHGLRAPVRAIAFVDDDVIGVADDGTLCAWNRGAGDPIHCRRLAPAVRAVAIDIAHRRIASAGIDPRIAINTLADGAPVQTLDWHGAQVLSLTWAGDTLVSGDANGRVAVWQSLP
jgi:Cu/Ag efflux protein CusF